MPWSATPEPFACAVKNRPPVDGRLKRRVLDFVCASVDRWTLPGLEKAISMQYSADRYHIRAAVRSLVDEGVRLATIRHPMPYGNLRAQAVQRFATVADLDRGGPVSHPAPQARRARLTRTLAIWTM